MKKALLVIDVQNYFVTEKALELPQKIAGYLEESSSDYDAVLFMKFRNDSASNFHTLLDFTEAKESPATDLHETLLPFVTSDNVFEKTTYSALKSEALRAYLCDNKIEELDMCGVSLDACVLASAYEAFDLGFKVRVLENLCSVSSARDDLMPAALIVINRNLRKRENRFKRT